MFRNLFDRMFWIFAAVLFVFNAIGSTVVYAFGLTFGYEGEPGLSWDQYVSALNGLFSDFVSLLALIGGIVLLLGAVALAGWFAHRRNVVGAIIWFLVGAIGGGWILFKVVDWSTFNVGFSPVVALIGFSLIEALAIRAVALRMQPANH
jgi:hypothetical protein